MSLRKKLQSLTLVCCAVWFYSSVAQAATVKAKSNRNPVVLIELSEDESAVRGDEICFFTRSARQVGCGRVVSVQGKRARVRTKRSVFSKVRRGMAAQAFGYADGNILGANSRGKSGSSGPSTWRFYGFGMVMMTPFSHQNLMYDRGTDTLWDPGEAASALAVGAGLELAIPIGSFAVIPGFRYQMERSQTIESDYGTTSNPFSVNTISSSAMGLWTDFEFWQGSWSSLTFGLASGLDIDMSKTNFTMQTKDENTGATVDIASANTTLNVTSLRLGSRIDYMFTKSFGVNFTPTILIPISELGKSFSGEVNDPNAPTNIDLATDLETALAHQKSSFGFIGTFSLLMTF